MSAKNVTILAHQAYLRNSLLRSPRKSYLEVSFPLEMLSVVILYGRSYSAVPLAEQPIHHWSTLLGPLVLKKCPLTFSTYTVDRNQTVSRRSKPNSRTTFIGEQPNPWNLLQLQDVMNRHRGAKQLHRYELLRVISLLSPAYLLSVERWSFHAEPPDHYNRLSSLLDMSVSQSGKHMLLRSTTDICQFEFTFVRLRYSLGGDRPSQTTHYAMS